MTRTVGAITGEAVRRERRRLKLNAEETAARYDDAGMTHTILMNIEAGRRRTPATIDEWLRLAYTLGVPPESLLLPDNDTEAEIAPGVTADRTLLLQWIRGQTPLPGTDERHYQQIAAITLPADSNRSLDAKAELLRRVGVMLDTVGGETEEIARNTRRQVFDLLVELQQLLESGTDRDQVIAKIETYKDRLAALT